MDSNYNHHFYYKINEECYKYIKREYDINNKILIVLIFIIFVYN